MFDFDGNSHELVVRNFLRGARPMLSRLDLPGVRSDLREFIVGQVTNFNTEHPMTTQAELLGVFTSLQDRFNRLR